MSTLWWSIKSFFNFQKQQSNCEQVKLITVFLLFQWNPDIKTLHIQSSPHRDTGRCTARSRHCSELSPCLRPQNAWINNFAPSSEYTDFDWPGGSRVIKRWWRTTLRVIAPGAAPIYLLSTVCWTIFLSVLQNKVVAAPGTRPATAHRGWTISVAASWRSDIGGEWRVARSCDWGGGQSDERHQSLDSYPLVMSQFQNSCNKWR